MPIDHPQLSSASISFRFRFQRISEVFVQREGCQRIRLPRHDARLPGHRATHPPNRCDRQKHTLKGPTSTRAASEFRAVLANSSASRTFLLKPRRWYSPTCHPIEGVGRVEDLAVSQDRQQAIGHELDVLGHQVFVPPPLCFGSSRERHLLEACAPACRRAGMQSPSLGPRGGR